MKKKQNGFTLMEILIAMSILIVGLVGILSLFPVGLSATKKAIEDTNAALIAESLYASLRAAAKKTVPGDNLYFFFDGMSVTSDANKFPPGGKKFKHTDLTGKVFGIPKHCITNVNTAATDVSDISAYQVIEYENIAGVWVSKGTIKEIAFAKLARGGSDPFDVTLSNKDQGQLKQYSYNIEISYPTGNPKGLYNVVIRIARRKTLIKKFYSQIMIPTE